MFVFSVRSATLISVIVNGEVVFAYSGRSATLISVIENGEVVFAYSGRSSILITVSLKMERMCLPTAADHPF